MHQLSKQNICVLCAAAVILVGAFVNPLSKPTLNIGICLAVAAFLVMKSTSPLSSTRFDVFISWLIVSFVVLARLSVFDLRPLLLDITAIILTIVFVFTGQDVQSHCGREETARDLSPRGPQ